MKALTKALVIAAVLCLGFGVACEKKEEAKADAPAAEAPTEAKKDEAAAPAEGEKKDEAAPEGEAPKAAPSSQ